MNLPKCVPLIWAVSARVKFFIPSAPEAFFQCVPSASNGEQLGHPLSFRDLAPFGFQAVVRTLMRVRLEAPRVDLPLPYHVLHDGRVSGMTSAPCLAGVLLWQVPNCSWEDLWADGLQLPWVAGRIARSFSGETCDPHVGKSDFF